MELSAQMVEPKAEKYNEQMNHSQKTETVTTLLPGEWAQLTHPDGFQN